MTKEEQLKLEQQRFDQSFANTMRTVDMLNAQLEKNYQVILPIVNKMLSQQKEVLNSTNPLEAIMEMNLVPPSPESLFATPEMPEEPSGAPKPHPKASKKSTKSKKSSKKPS